VALVAFAVFAAYRRNWKPLFAAFAWMTGWEAAWQATNIALGHGHPLWLWGTYTLFVVGPASTLLACRLMTPSLFWATVLALLWIVWLATGFHSNNHTLVGFNPLAEALNEAAKTAWALVYLWPLARATLWKTTAPAGVVPRFATPRPSAPSESAL
jgi:hypothetical protein